MVALIHPTRHCLGVWKECPIDYRTLSHVRMTVVGRTRLQSSPDSYALCAIQSTSVLLTMVRSSKMICNKGPHLSGSLTI